MYNERHINGVKYEKLIHAQNRYYINRPDETES